MEAMSAQGKCVCGVFTKVYGKDVEDAMLLLNHAHGHDQKHLFEGEVTYKEANYPVCSTKGMPRRSSS